MDETNGFVIPVYSGSIGGKGNGLDLAHTILEEEGLSNVVKIPETYALGTDAFTRFLEYNKLKERLREAEKDADYKAAEKVREDIVNGDLPEDVKKGIDSVLEKIEGPIAVRSSSMLEDGTDHPYAGIYLSVFVSSEAERREDVYNAVKRVLASTIGEPALALRKRRKINKLEHMAVLFQPVVGRRYNDTYFMPDLAGVIFTRNPYLWSKRMRERDGIVRMVFGLGTRAVGRDYANMFDPSLPGLHPTADYERVKHSQENVDVLPFRVRPEREDGALEVSLKELLDDIKISNPRYILSRAEGGYVKPLSTNMLDKDKRYVVTFDELLKMKPFLDIINGLIRGMDEGFSRKGIRGGVDMEFAANLDGGSNIEVLLLQARPLVHRGEMKPYHPPKHVKENDILTLGPATSNGRVSNISYAVLVDGESYSALNMKECYLLARTIGRINTYLKEKGERFILIGPGRWGSNNPELGVPVNYSEIANASAILEVSSDGFAGEPSFGTHFFNDMVADGIPFINHDEGRKGGEYSSLEGLLKYENVFEGIAKEMRLSGESYSSVKDALRIIKPAKGKFELSMDSGERKAWLYPLAYVG